MTNIIIPTDLQMPAPANKIYPAGVVHLIWNSNNRNSKMKEEEKRVIIEYGNEDLKEILSNYIMQTFAELLNKK